MKRFMTTRMAMSVLVITVALAMVGMGTFAWFSDTETSAGNTFGAGTLDLNVNGQDTPVSYFTVSDLAPGWSDTYSVAVENVGSIDGSSLSVTVLNLVDDDVSCNDPEAAVEGAGCGGTGTGTGELSANMTVSIDDGTTTFYSGTLLGAVDASPISIGSLGAGDTVNLNVSGSIPATAGNDIQSDSATFDVRVDLVQ